MIKVAKVPKLIIKIIKTLLENCKNNQKISLKNLDFMPNLRQNATKNLTVRLLKGEFLVVANRDTICCKAIP